LNTLTILTLDGIISVASLTDLLATKLTVILQRAEAKDYIEIAALIGANID
jgi:predicted nucleotidyltransferase component of viral defense system